jgi:hypothetical protein
MNTSKAEARMPNDERVEQTPFTYKIMENYGAIVFEGLQLH